MANEAGNGTVQWDVDARGVATVVLNRPQVNNAYDGDLVTDIHEVLDRLGAHAGLRAVVIRGNGKHFQAGADLTWLDRVGRESPEENVRVSHATGDAVRRLDGVPVPTIALVHGACIGGGTGIIAACDVVVASEDAIFAISESRWGMMAGVIFPQLVQAIGLRQLRRYAITGERLDARDQERHARHEIQHTEATLALCDQMMRAVGRRHVPQQRREPAHTVEVVRTRRVEGRILLQQEADLAARADRLTGARHRHLAIGRHGHHDAREQHEIPHRQDDQHVLRQPGALAGYQRLSVVDLAHAHSRPPADDRGGSVPDLGPLGPASRGRHRKDLPGARHPPSP